MILPKYLYRGDRDSLNTRKLKNTVGSGLLLTNLCSGGDGKKIFNQTLAASINTHVSIGWDKTHFLSFSEDEERALYYATGNFNDYEEVYDLKGAWDFVLLTFDTGRLTDASIEEVKSGLYKANFIPSCKEFQPSFPTYLIDVSKHLKSLSAHTAIDLRKAIANAEQDKEWLVLPAFPFGNGEFSSKLDTNCISDLRVYAF